MDTELHLFVAVCVFRELLEEKKKKSLPITGYENAVLCIGLPMKPS